MLINKKIITITCVLAVITFSAMTSMRADDDTGYKNLKVLPKHITHDELGNVMHGWSKALGVHCNFCHAKGDDGKMDFPSDAKPEKNMARKMYVMAAKINNKYFEGKKDSLGMVIGDIKCVTCHRGSPHPDEVKDMGTMGGDHDMHGPGTPPPPPAPPAQGTPPPPPGN
jgi:Photosynthetic reaction centre cytochrome C subunit